MSSSRPGNWEQLGDYKLLGKFAQGHSAVLHLAVHRGSPDTRTALRAVKMPLAEFRDDPSFTNLLVAEAQLLACIQHPNVVGAYGFGREHGGYVALDYVEGDDLQSLQAATGGPTDPRIVAAIIADALQGLSALHEAVGEVGEPLSAVHLAPHGRHILVGTDGRARLADFSHARLRSQSHERRTLGRLHAAYRAPEQLDSAGQVDARTDLFVLGIAFWEALTGRGLFAAGTHEQVSQNIRSMSIAAPSLITGHQRSSALERVCMRALAREPQARFASAKEMLTALLDAALSIGGIALPAEVGRWVSAQAADTLKRRSAQLGLSGANGAAPSNSSMPQPSRSLSTRPEIARPYDGSKTLMGTGLFGAPARSDAPAATPPTGPADLDSAKGGSFRPSRPSSSRPPPAPRTPLPPPEAGSPARASMPPLGAVPRTPLPPPGESAASRPTAPGPSPSPMPAAPAPSAVPSAASAGPAPTSIMSQPPAEFISTEGVETARDPEPRTVSGVPSTRPSGRRITEEYVASPRRERDAMPAPDPRRERDATPMPDPRRERDATPMPDPRRELDATPTPAPLREREVASMSDTVRSARVQSTGGTPSQVPSPEPSAPTTLSEPPMMPGLSGVPPSVEPRRVRSPRPDAPPVVTEPARPSRSSLPPVAPLPVPSWRSVALDFVGMSVFAIVTVLLGDSLIRGWFGSPYGPPQVAPVRATRDPGSP